MHCASPNAQGLQRVELAPAEPHGTHFSEGSEGFWEAAVFTHISPVGRVQPASEAYWENAEMPRFCALQAEVDGGTKLTAHASKELSWEYIARMRRCGTSKRSGTMSACGYWVQYSEGEEDVL